MKRLIFLGACWAGLLIRAWAQSPPEPIPDSTKRQDYSPAYLSRNGLKINLTSVRSGEFGLLFARRLTPETLILGGLGPNFTDALFSKFHPSNFQDVFGPSRDMRQDFKTGLWLRGEFRLYPMPDEFPGGPYLAAMLRYKRFSIHYQGTGYYDPSQKIDHTTSHQFFDYSILAGVEVELYQGFTLDAQLGFGNRTSVFSRLEVPTIVGADGRITRPAEFSDFRNNFFMPYVSFMLGYYFH